MSDQQYSPFPYLFTSKGLVALSARDRAPEGTFFNSEGFEVRQEGALSSRLGRTAITTDGTNNFPILNGPNHPITITTLARLKATGTNTYRYAFGYDPITGLATGFLYRRTGDTNGAYSQVLVSGAPVGLNRLSAVTYRPAFSSTPYIFFADQSAMMKDSGIFSILQNWGFSPPFGLVFASVQTNGPGPDVTGNGNNYDYRMTLYNQITGLESNPTATMVTVNTVAPVNQSVIITWPASTFSYNDTQATHFRIYRRGGTLSSQWLLIATVLTTTASYLDQFTDAQIATSPVLQIDNDPPCTTALASQYNSTTAGAIAWDATAGHSANGTDNHSSTVITVTIVAGQTAVLIVSAASGTQTVTSVSGGGTWSLVKRQVNGAVTCEMWSVPAISSSSAASITVNYSGSANTVFAVDQYTGVTGYVLSSVTSNTGVTANPSIQLTTTATRSWVVAGFGIIASSPPGAFTGTNLRGANATTGVAGALTDIAAGSIGPITSTVINGAATWAAVAVEFATSFTPSGFQTVTVSDATTFYPYQVVIFDSGVNQEIVLIIQVLSTTQFKAIFQIPHTSGAPVIINSKPQQAMNLAAIGSQQAFLAGDPVNPNRLYYSKNQNPEAFPPQNYIEVGVPSDPIMAVVSIRGQIFVLTQSRIWRILSFGGGTPQPIPTGSRHGLSANFAWAIAEQSIIYLSYDGVYSFLADDSAYISEQIEWVFSDKQPNLGPLDPLDSTKRSSAIAAYNKGEFFLCYMGVSGSKRRMIYDTVNKRWRNDSVSCDAMFFEEDTGELIISELGDGMIYKDRRSDWDQEGFIAGVRQSVAIPLNLETPSLDQGYPRNDKVYNEFTLDLDTGGSTLNVFLLFDNAATPVSLGTVGGVAGRKQVTFSINSGNGQVSKNVALRITGSVSPTVAAVHLYQWHIKAAVDAEQRKTFDTYWAKMGTDEFKFVKQGYFEILAPDPGGITFNVYLEGSATATYSFSLPQALVRTSVKVRFPATKAKLWRFVATSAGDFKLYGESFLEVKPISSDKGYGKFPFGQVTAQGGV